MVHIRRTSAPLGAIVTGLVPGELSRAEIGDLYRAWLDHGVLVFKGLDVDVGQHLALSELFGEADLHPIEAIRHPAEPLLIVLAANGGRPVADDDPDADRIIGQIPWHADQIYTDTPNRGALLRAVTIAAEGGDTGWIDTAGLYRDLPYPMKCRLQGLRIIHSYAKTHQSQSMVGGGADLFPDVIHPLVFVHPESGLPVLNISPSTAKAIVGPPAGEADELLAWLIDFATREERAYVHVWEAGDLVLWDNWRTIHRAYGHRKRYPRMMERTTIRSTMTLGQRVDEAGPLIRRAAA